MFHYLFPCHAWLRSCADVAHEAYVRADLMNVECPCACWCWGKEPVSLFTLQQSMVAFTMPRAASHVCQPSWAHTTHFNHRDSPFIRYLSYLCDLNNTIISGCVPCWGRKKFNLVRRWRAGAGGAGHKVGRSEKDSCRFTEGMFFTPPLSCNY